MKRLHPIMFLLYIGNGKKRFLPQFCTFRAKSSDSLRARIIYNVYMDEVRGFPKKVARMFCRFTESSYLCIRK